MARISELERITNETKIRIKLNLDGTGLSKIDSGIPFLDHMLSFIPVHGFMDLDLSASGDTEIDDHHTVEDIGICLGLAIAKALEEKKGIKRYGNSIVPMDEVLVRVVMDISNRPALYYRVPLKKNTAGNFDVNLVREFFRALVIHAGITMHIDLLEGDEPHHIAEGVFKAFARALDIAVSPEERLDGKALSSKGVL